MPLYRLQLRLKLVGEVDDLVVDSELLAAIRNDKHTNGARATAESLLETRPEVTLVNDAETLLDLTSLGHGDELAVIADVDETVLLEDGAKERVEDHGGRGVGDDARLLVELLGEEVHTEVTVLAGLRGGGDADDLARAVLEDHQITDADVVAGDGEGVGLARVHGGDVRRGRAASIAADGSVDRLGDVQLAVCGGVAILAAAAGVGGGILGVLVVFTHVGGFGGFLVGDRRERRDGGLGFQRRREAVSFFDDDGLGDDGGSKLFSVM